MKFSYNWLREMVDGLDASPAELERLITIKTAECEGVEQHGDDHVIEVDNKSLTHRPDLWGHHGMAREVAAIAGRKLLNPVKAMVFPQQPPAVHVSIEDYTLCPRYSALMFDNVTVGVSPAWLTARLEAVGLNPINNIVDLTNFVMAELAQPMHAFDAAKLHGDEIRVRAAEAGEIFAALNEETYELDATNLVIADAEGPIALAGVIGGAGSAISGATTRIVLESANFNASNIRKTSSRIKLRTDASMRFEKAQDPINTVRALERAYELLQLVSPGIRLVGGLADAYQDAPVKPSIMLPLQWLARKLGRSLPVQEVRQILESLEFGVEQIDEDTLSILVPTWRATKDISIKEDLVEEVGRMVGYASIPPTPPLTPARVPPASPQREYQHEIREMAAAQGFTEVYNYSFVNEDAASAFGFELADHIQVINPIAADQNLLRISLLPGILRNIQDNARHADEFRLFEIGREIHPDHEAPHFVAAIFAKSGNGADGLLDLKRLAECLLPDLQIRPIKAVALTRGFEHPQRTAEVVTQSGIVIGRLFEFHPNYVQVGRAAILDLDLTLLEQAQPARARYQSLRRFPDSAFDLSLKSEPRALIADVQSELAKSAGPLLLHIAFLREFVLPSGHRSLSYRLTVGATDRTLSMEEVNAVRGGVIQGMLSAGYDIAGISGNSPA